jgi:hypothetical protein
MTKYDFYGGIIMKLKDVSALVAEADNAVAVLEKYQLNENETKQKDILMQVCRYIQNLLIDANWIFSGASYFNDIYMNGCGVLYIGHGGAINYGTPVAQITRNGIKMLNPMGESETLMLVRNWERFKEKLILAIDKSIKDKQIEIDKRVSHIAYVKKEYDTFHV